MTRLAGRIKICTKGFSSVGPVVDQPGFAEGYEQVCRTRVTGVRADPGLGGCCIQPSRSFRAESFLLGVWRRGAVENSCPGHARCFRWTTSMLLWPPSRTPSNGRTKIRKCPCQRGRRRELSSRRREPFGLTRRIVGATLSPQAWNARPDGAMTGCGKPERRRVRPRGRHAAPGTPGRERR